MEDARLDCPACGASYPVVDGIPVLIDESRSIFSLRDFIERRETTLTHRSGLKARVRSLLPSLSVSPQSPRTNRVFHQLLLEQSSSPIVLVIGAGDRSEGIQFLLDDPRIEVVESDVYFGARTALIADGHSLPIADGTIDAIVAQSVLSYVLDPVQCVAEMHRVLVPRGLVLVETPFMQQVVMGHYDFTRWTPLGHRRLFRNFEQVIGGPNGGEGMVLAWAWHYFLRGFARGQRGRAIARVVASLTAFWLLYFDRYLAGRPPAWDGAKGSYFVGRRSERALDDHELVKLYEGLDRRMSSPSAASRDLRG